VYLPCEGALNGTADFVNQLTMIDSLIDKYCDCHIIVCGDFNVDFNRDWSHTNLLHDFCVRNNVTPASNYSNYLIDYTYSFDHKRFATIDHFLLSDTLFQTAIKSVAVAHDNDNMSDHEPILLQLSLDCKVLQSVEQMHSEQLSWHKASKADLRIFGEVVDRHLATIRVPTSAINCTDNFCKNSQHIHDLDRYAAEITGVLLDASVTTIPKTSNRHASKHRIPGWTEFVEPARQKSALWHSIWVQCGRPRSGEVAAIMRKTRASYHYAIRHIRKHESDIVRQRFAEAVLENDNRAFWNEAKKLTNSHRSVSSSVDGQTNPADIAHAFAEKYESLYNDVSFSPAEMQQLRAELDNQLSDDPMDDVIISADEVARAIAHLKWHKRDGYKGLSTNHLKHASPSIHQHLAHLFNGMIRHGSVPDDFLQGTTIPIPKNRSSNASVSTNYRGITLSSVFGRVFDLIVLDRYSSVLQSDQLQFGFKAKHSTAMCTMVLREIISSYVSEQSAVYCTFLDASKAFDKINYCRLFELLMRRHIPRTILRLLLNIYTGQSVRVFWNGYLSSTFPVTNGVKQGGILSPILFCVYYDELIQELRRTRTGCHIGSWFVGVLAYADDLALLAPSASAMRKLLATCELFAERFSLSFNADKSKCMCFEPHGRLHCDRTLPKFEIHGGAIDFVDSWVHLGHTLTTDLNTEADIMRGRNALIGQINNFLCQFGKLDVVTKNRLFLAYCSSHYGSVLWDLDCRSLDAYAAAWRTGLRRIWRLPFNSHCAIVSLVSMTVPLIDVICQRFINHMVQCLNGPNDVASFVVRQALSDIQMASSITRNLFLCSKRFNCDSGFLLSQRFTSSALRLSVDRRVSAEDASAAYAVLELLFVREGQFSLDGFHRYDVEQFINILSNL
jgi:hypothetical protein